MNKEQIAKVAHQANKALCESIDDNSQLDWENAPDWQKESAKNGVAFHLNIPMSLPADSHANWMKEKIADGWVYGREKNPELKTHPCLIPYEELPTEQRAKDWLFHGIVKALADFVE
jgi:hypothetical protein